MPQLLYPGHKYLGPGNPLKNGNPVDKADSIAWQHDHEYHDARTVKDVRDSDWKAIKAFGSDFLSRPNLPSAAGFVGLGVKTATERALNTTIYPNIGKNEQCV